MRLPRTRTLVLVLIAAAVAWWFLTRPRSVALPWNVGQAGMIFSPGLKGGGQ